MSANIKNIADAAEEKLKIANELESSAADGQSEMEETERGIKRVADSAGVIMEMTQIIQDIASRTNLLAMNAASRRPRGRIRQGFRRRRRRDPQSGRIERGKRRLRDQGARRGLR